MVNGIWYSNKAFSGKKICKAIKKLSSGESEIVGISDTSDSYHKGRLPSSFLIPQDDPQYNKDGTNALGMYGYLLNSRSWIYDAGLSLLVFAVSGDFDICIEMQDRLKDEQNIDGSFNFSYDLYIGQLFEGYVRTGAIGWLVWGMCYYALKSGDTQFIPMIKKASDWLCGRQITKQSDPRFGLLTGGYGAYSTDGYTYEPTVMQWCSIEHNCSALQALHGTALITGDTKYAKVAENIKHSLLAKAYDRENKRFVQGVRLEGNDGAWAVDCCTWAGKQALSVVGFKIPTDCASTAYDEFHVSNIQITQSINPENYNTRYSLDSPTEGFKPYSDRDGGYSNSPNIVWTEGTLGYCALQSALGNWDEVKRFVDATIDIQNCNGSTGGVLYATTTHASLPWEFHVWESVVSSAWLFLVIKCPDVLFPIVMKKANVHNKMKEGG